MASTDSCESANGLSDSVSLRSKPLDQYLLLLEVVVKITRADVQLGGDAVGRNLRQTLVVEGFQGRLQDAVASSHESTTVASFGAGPSASSRCCRSVICSRIRASSTASGKPKRRSAAATRWSRTSSKAGRGVSARRPLLSRTVARQATAPPPGVLAGVLHLRRPAPSGPVIAEVRTPRSCAALRRGSCFS